MYPSHIPISFPYSHILPYPYIPHIHVSIFLSVPPVALPPVFSHFSFFLYRGRNRMSWCVFLVVFWCRFCGWFSSRLSFRPSTRFPRFVSRPVPRFSPRPVLPVSFFAPLFSLPFVSFVRLGVSWGGSFGTGRCLGRGDWLVVWRGEMTGCLSCAPFLSARVRGHWQWSLVFRSPRLASRLFCSFRRGGRCVALLTPFVASFVSVLRFARCRERNAVAMGCRPVFSSRLCLFDWRPVSSRLLLVVAVALFGFVSSGVSCGGVFSVVWAPAVWRCVVAECGRCGVAMGVAMFVVWRRGGVACRGSCRWRFGDAVSCGGACGAGRAAGRMAR